MRTIDSYKEGFWIDSCAYAREMQDAGQYVLTDVRERGDGDRVYEVWVDVNACGLDESQVRKLDYGSNLAMIDGDLCYLDALVHISGDLEDEHLPDEIWKEFVKF